MRRQRGVVLLTAVVLMALAAIIAATIAYNTGMAARRGVGNFTFDQGIQYAAAAEAIAGVVLREDAKDSNTDDYSERWAQPYGPLEIVKDVWLEAQLDDAQGRFNVNNLIDADGVVRPEAVTQFERLLSLVGLEPKWASLIADWIDADIEPTGFDGGEDSLYLAQSPPYRAPNLPVVSVSELLALPGFGAERYARISPFLSALPPGTPLNLCTASAEVLDAIGDEDEFTTDRENLAKLRENGCFPTKADMQARAPIDEWPKIQFQVAEKSNYFRLRSFVSLGTTEFALYSLLKRETTGVRPILRTYGTD